MIWLAVGAAALGRVRLLGIMTTHGNQTVAKTTANALTALSIARARGVPVVAGATEPLVRKAAICPEIHGEVRVAIWASLFVVCESRGPKRKIVRG